MRTRFNSHSLADGCGSVISRRGSSGSLLWLESRRSRSCKREVLSLVRAAKTSFVYHPRSLSPRPPDSPLKSSSTLRILPHCVRPPNVRKGCFQIHPARTTTLVREWDGNTLTLSPWFRGWRERPQKLDSDCLKIRSLDGTLRCQVQRMMIARLWLNMTT